MDTVARYGRRLAAVAIIPLAFIIFGWYGQSHMTVPQDLRDKDQAFLTSLREKLASFEEMVSKNPSVLECKEQALAMLRRDLAMSERYLTLDERKSTVLSVIFWTGLAALLTGIGSLLYISWSGRQSLQSREEFITQFEKARRWIPLGSCIHIALVISSCFATVALLRYESVQLWLDTGEGSYIHVLPIVVFVATVYFFVPLLWRIIGVLRDHGEMDRFKTYGEMVNRDDAPLLWRHMEETASRLGVSVPDNLVVGLTPEFFISSGEIELAGGGPVLDGVTAYVPLTFMPFLDRDEYTSVLGHELSHLAAGDLVHNQRENLLGLRYAVLFSGLDMIHSIRSVWQNKAAASVFAVAGYLLEKFEETRCRLSRDRELAADELSKRVSSARSRAVTLIRTAVTFPAIESVLQDLWENPHKNRGSLIESMVNAAVNRDLSDPLDQLETIQPHPYDSHPSFRQRLEALGIPYNDPMIISQATRRPDSGASAVALLPQVDAVCARLVTVFQNDAIDAQRRHESELIETAAPLFDRPFEVFMRRRYIRILLAMPMVFLLCVATVTMLTNMEIKYGVFCLLIAGLFLWWCLPDLATVWRRREPFLVLSADGIGCTFLTRDIPWTTVRDFSVSVDGSTYINLTLCDEASVPDAAGLLGRRHVHQNQYGLVLFFGPVENREKKKIKPKEIADEILKRFHGLVALEVLEERKEERRKSDGRDDYGVA